jgi:hypothetical protein
MQAQSIAFYVARSPVERFGFIAAVVDLMTASQDRGVSTYPTRRLIFWRSNWHQNSLATSGVKVDHDLVYSVATTVYRSHMLVKSLHQVVSVVDPARVPHDRAGIGQLVQGTGRTQTKLVNQGTSKHLGLVSETFGVSKLKQFC